MTIVVRTAERTEVVETRGSTNVENRGGGRAGGASAALVPVTPVSVASYAVAIADRFLIVDTASNPVTVNLRPAVFAGNGGRLDVKFTNGANPLTIDGNGAETIDGDLTLVVPSINDNVSLLCDGTKWYVI